MGAPPEREGFDLFRPVRRAVRPATEAFTRTFPRAAAGLGRNRILVETVLIVAISGLVLRLLFGGNLLQVIVNGLVVGSIYVVGATGLSLIYGIKKFANFAHGDLITLGAYVAFFLNVGVGREISLGITVLIALLSVLGLVFEVFIFFRLARQISRNPLIVSLLLHAALPTVAIAAVYQRLYYGVAIGGYAFVLVVALMSLAILLLKLLIYRQMKGRGSTLVAASVLVHAIILLSAAAVLVKLAFGVVDLVLALAFSVVVLGFVGILLEVLIFNKLEGKGLVAPLIASVGIFIVIQNVINAVFGTEPETFDIIRARNWVIGGPGDFIFVQINPVKGVLTFAVAVGATIGLHLLLSRTSLGKAMRATSDNVDLARSSGINTRNVTLWTWVISCMLAALAGILLGMAIDVRPLLGFNILLFLFAAVIIGGIGSPYGAMIGGFLVGVVQELSGILLDWLALPSVIGLEVAAAYRPMAAFLVMIIVLLIKPEGLMGTSARGELRGAGLLARLRRV